MADALNRSRGWKHPRCVIIRTNAHLMTSLATRWVLEVVFQALSRDAKMVAKTAVVFAQRSRSRAYDVDNGDTVNPEGKKAYTHAMEPRGTTKRKHEFACVLPTGVTICDPLSSPRRPRARHSILFEGRSRYSRSRELAVSVESNVFREDVFHILCRHYFRRRSYGSSALFYTIVARRVLSPTTFVSLLSALCNRSSLCFGRYNGSR